MLDRHSNSASVHTAHRQRVHRYIAEVNTQLLEFVHCVAQIYIVTSASLGLNSLTDWFQGRSTLFIMSPVHHGSLSLRQNGSVFPLTVSFVWVPFSLCATAETALHVIHSVPNNWRWLNYCKMRQTRQGAVKERTECEYIDIQNQKSNRWMLDVVQGTARWSTNI